MQPRSRGRNNNYFRGGESRSAPDLEKDYVSFVVRKQEVKWLMNM